MKGTRLCALLMSILMMLSVTSCGKKEEPDTSSQSQPAVSSLYPLPDPEPAPQPEPLPQPEPEPEPEFPFTNPLTGEGCMTDISQQRPIAVMINNHKSAQPQVGISQADIIYEIPAEGGITRMLAVFQDVTDAGNIGTVRSARDYYVSMAYGMDAIYLHAGGSPQAYTVIKQWGVPALDCVNGPYEGTLYWRDAARKKSGGFEHSVLTSSEKILELLPTYGLRMEHKEGYSYPMSFTEDAAPTTGLPADTITVKFSDYKTGIFRYDADTGLYYVEQYGKPHVDGNTNEQLAMKNILLVQTDISVIKGDEAGRLSVRTTGTGKGKFACGGMIENITWSKESHSKPMVFKTEDGEPLEFGVGSTYICFVGGSSSYGFE